jgi:hypothetical protein
VLLVVSYTPIKTAAVRMKIIVDIVFIILIDRFWGWTENASEVAKDQAELSQLAKEGKALYGDSYMPEYVQDASSRNSRFSQLKFCKSDIVFFSKIRLTHVYFSRFPLVQLCQPQQPRC